jgi:hypothetical protein
MFENLDQLIDTNLKIIADSREKQIFLGSFQDIGSSHRVEQLKFANILEQKGLITIEPNKGQRCDLTEYGFEIHKLGGWLKYLEIQKKKQEYVDKIEELEAKESSLLAKLELQKSITEQKLNKRHLKTFWIIFGVVVLSALYNIYDFISKFNKEETPNEEMVTKEELQKELLDLRKTLILELQKNDSLTNIQNKTDSAP